jgi:hypothetical protein
MAIAFRVQDGFETGLSQLFSVLSDVSSWVVFDRPRLISAKNGEVKLAFEDGSRAIISFEIIDGGVRANIVHELLKDESEIKPRQLYWQEVLAGMHRRLDQK